MNFHELARKRCSVRSYDAKRQIKDNILRKILETTMQAPSAVNFQPWEFLVISSEEMKEKVYETYSGEWIKAAPLLIVIKGLKDKAWTRQKDRHNYCEVDLSIAMDHLTLAAAEEGLGTCWIGNFDPQALRKVLNLKENEIVSAFTPIGYEKDASKRRPKTRKDFHEVVKFI